MGNKKDVIYLTKFQEHLLGQSLIYHMLGTKLVIMASGLKLRMNMGQIVVGHRQQTLP